MKKLYLTTFAICILSSLNSFAQRPWHQPEMEVLDINNMSAPFMSNGGMFWNFDPSNSSQQNLPPAVYQSIPKNTAIGTIFAGSLWIGGYDTTNQLYIASDTYRQGVWMRNHVDQSTSFGPIATNYNATYDAKYNKVWKVNASQINGHKMRFRWPNYIVPPAIAEWPAHGNTANGEAANLAPFVDVNSNSIYDPQNGDYPAIRGDQAVYFIHNDSRFRKTPHSPAMEVEIHGMAYAFDAQTDTALNNTIFVNFKIVNRSNRDYHDVRIGMWTDFDIGHWSNDYIGADVANNAYFGYNGTENDTTVMIRPSQVTQDTGTVRSYGSQPPAQGVMLLGGPQMSSFMTYTNDFSGWGNPQIAEHFYNYMNAKWPNGDTLTFGGKGKKDFSIHPYRFMYPGDSDPIGIGYEISGQLPPFAWTEEALDGTGAMNMPSDRRGIGAFGPITLNAGASYCFDVAYPFAQGTDRLHSVWLLKQYFQHITNFYNTNIGSACIQNTSGSTLRVAQQSMIYPNPANDNLTIELPASEMNNMLEVKVFNLSGNLIYTENISPDNHQYQHINISGITNGMYIIQLQQGQHTSREKLIIAR